MVLVSGFIGVVSTKGRFIWKINILYVVPKTSALMWICKPLFLGKITIFSYPAQVLEVAVHLLHNV